jgi:hypothetical protein
MKNKINQSNVPVKSGENQERSLTKVLNENEKANRINILLKKKVEIQRELIEINRELIKIERPSVDGPPLNSDEKSMIECFNNKKRSVESKISYDAKHSTGFGANTENGTESDRFNLLLAGLSVATGSTDLSFSYMLLTKCIQASCIGTKQEDEEIYQRTSNAITNALTAMKPQDEIEGMLISQLIALHFQSMQYLGCAANKEATTEGRDNNINRSTKLSRLYNETLEALMRYRRRGEQKVTVTHQHVQVNDGGKAIVGNVINGGGEQQQNGEIPHGYS